MKKKIYVLSAVLGIGMGLFLSSCCFCGNYKYEIRHDGYHYHTNSYKVSGNCINFVTNDRPMTICGTYSIEENKDYKPEKKDK